jgi:hypothetical protein
MQINESYWRSDAVENKFLYEKFLYQTLCKLMSHTDAMWDAVENFLANDLRH